MIRAFSAEELKAYDAARGGRRWWHALTDPLPWSRKSRLERSRDPNRSWTLLDCWVNPDDAPAHLMGGGVQGWEETLDSTTADGTAVTAAAETIACPDFNIPAYYMAPGRTLRIWAMGVVSSVVTTPGTGVWSVRWGGVGGVLLCKSGAQNFHTTAQTNVGWNLWVLVTCRTAGATGTFMSAGELNCFNVLDTTSANLKPAVMGSAGTASNAQVTVDTTAAKLLSVTFTQTVTTGSMTCQQRVIEALN
jgi:hypothetical protein